MSDRIVYRFPKNTREEVRATLTEFKGYNLADLRVFAIGDEDEEHPTRKGLTIRVDDLPKLLEAVQALIEARGEAA